MSKLRRNTWPASVWLPTFAVALLLLTLKSLPAPLGEPLADDFDYLHRAILEGTNSLLDGGGAHAYWRPVGRQMYFTLTSWLMLHQSGAVAALQAVIMFATSVMLFRALRGVLSDAGALFAGTFVLLAEGARMLIAWPSNFMDVACMCFAVLALHEALRARLVTMAAAMLLSLMSKEIGLVSVLVIPFVPGLAAGVRRRAMFASASVVACWAAAYLFVERHAQLIALPGRDVLAAGIATVLRSAEWALVGTLRTAFSLPPDASPILVRGCTLVMALTLGGAAWAAWRRRDIRLRLHIALPWVLWGSAWFALSSAALALLWPAWTPYRAVFGAIGLGIALGSGLGAVSAALLAVVAMLRLALLLLSPGPPDRITPAPPGRGAYLDFPRLVRLERLVAQTREALRRAHPSLPHGAVVGIQAFPLLGTFAFSGDKAIQVWYADTSLRWVFIDEQGTRRAAQYAAILEYEPSGSHQIALVAPSATAGVDSALSLMSQSYWNQALSQLARADSAQSDRSASVFLGALYGRRAVCLLSLGRTGEAEEEARQGTARWHYNPDARVTLASILFDRGDAMGAEAEIDTMLIYNPNDLEALQIHQTILSRTPGR